MRNIHRYFGSALLVLIAGLYLVGCSTDNNPLSPDTETGQYTVTVQVEPPTVLRTPETKDLWTEPVKVSYSVDGSGSATKIFHADSIDDSWYLGSQSADGMEIMLRYGGGRDLYALHGPGMMNAMHPDAGSHHYMVEIYANDTIPDGPQAMPVIGSEVKLLAISGTDTLVYPLDAVMGEHGYAYEANADLPEGTYTLQLQLDPPEFYRTDETRRFWTDSIALEFQAFTFDSTRTPGIIGNRRYINDNGDTLEVNLSGEEPRQYGAMGMQWAPLTGEETVRFSLEIGDPNIQSAYMPIYGTQVWIMVRNDQTGNTETTELKPIFGHHGFYFGENMNVEMMDEQMHTESGSHGVPGEHMDDADYDFGGGMGMGGM